MTYSLYSYDVTEFHENYVDEVELHEILTGFDCMCKLETKLEMLGDNLCEDVYLIIGIDEETGIPVEVSGVYFMHDGDNYIDCAEHDFRVIASVGFGVDLV